METVYDLNYDEMSDENVLYSDGLRDFSETLDAIRTVDEFIDDHKEKLNSNVKKQK